MTACLAVLDVDSTLITSEVIELLAEHAGTRDEVALVTEAAMRGELDFAQSLARRVATLRGLDVSVFEDVRADIRLTPGAENLIQTLHGEGWTTALVSGGFTEIVGGLAASLGIERHRANGLEVLGRQLTGKTRGPIVDRAAKAAALRDYAAELDIPLERTVAIGDGANDLDMMATAGLGIAFNAKPLVQEQADVAVNSTRLDAVLPVLIERGLR